MYRADSAGKIFRDVCWENVWYNYSITTLDLVKVEVLYMDAVRKSLPGQTSNAEIRPRPAAT
mgnify:CR=1 FL=1